MNDVNKSHTVIGIIIARQCVREGERERDIILRDGHNRRRCHRHRRSINPLSAERLRSPPDERKREKETKNQKNNGSKVTKAKKKKNHRGKTDVISMRKRRWRGACHHRFARRQAEDANDQGETERETRALLIIFPLPDIPRLQYR